MAKSTHHVFVASVAVVTLFGWLSEGGTLARNGVMNNFAFRSNIPTDTTDLDTITAEGYRKSRRPNFRPKDRVGDPFVNRPSRSPMQLKNPANVELDVNLDDSLKNFEIREKIGEQNFRNPTLMTYEEYTKFQQQQGIKNYWRSKAEGGVTGEKASGRSMLSPKIPVVSPLFDRIFGGNFVDIQTNGNAGLKFGARFNRNFNQSLPLRRQRTGDFEFDQNLAINVTGRIGEKLKLNFNWDTKANFEFENNIKMDYTGYEEEIIRKIEAGNVSLPLNNSLISGSQNLFGVKAQLQFGRLGVTTVLSNVRGRTDQINIQNGAQNRPFEIKVDQYERDRHYFLSQFFRDRYDRALSELPQLKSGITIRRLEVYITNDNRSTENLRNVVTLMDLAEADTTKTLRDPLVYKPGTLLTVPASNDANRLYSLVSGTRNNNTVDETLQGPALGLQKSVDFEHVRARRLDPNEYKFNAELGYISLNIQMLPEQVLGVAYEYTLNGRVYRVGELQDDYQNVGQDGVIYLKMLKSTNPALNLPTWDLMMKNVYSLNANQINRQGFQLNIVYKDDESGVDITSIKEGQKIKDIPLVEVFNLDKVNTNNDAPADGNFDFLTGLTIDPENGRIFFPAVEPFGSYLQRQFVPGEENLVQKYVYQELYDLTQSDAQQVTNKAKFFLRGRYQASATDEIALPGIQIAQGSVRVRAGGNLLTEGVDYSVDYALARVKILNPSYLNSASNLAVEFEKTELINPQPRAMVGTRFDYAVNRDIGLGATLLHLGETPYNNNRVSIGDEPSNNTIYGLDINLKRESRLLTTLTDKLPFVQTKEPSAFSFNAEFAQLLPARAKLKGEDGVSYIDDFEGAESTYSLSGATSTPNWRLAATPAPLVPGAGLAYANNRAHLAWYTIDQGVYYRNGTQHPDNIGDADLRNHYIRGINRKEIFPQRDADAVNNYEYPFDLAYYPGERGQYNYNPDATGPNGKFLPNPAANWGGISREITFDTDFDNANIEYMEFWMMDPFLKVTNPNTTYADINDDEEGTPKAANTTGGELVFNLGNVSEDLLRDQNRYEFENGLPTESFAGNPTTTTKTDTDRTPWGMVTRRQFLTDAFDNTSGARQFQDIGLEGLNNTEEKQFFSGIYAQMNDPSNDDFRHHLNEEYDRRNVKVLGRYKYFNGMEGNSAENSVEAAYSFPDKEDLNKDNIISDIERYYEYKINLRPGQLNVGQNYIVDKVEKQGRETNGDKVTWYLFRIPVRQPTGNVGNIQGFKSIRFMRMYLTQFQTPVVLRMVQMQFVSNQWRKYLGSVSDGGVPCTGNCDTDVENYTVSTVNIEENGEADTGNIPYKVPPGIYRQFDNSSITTRRQNEQSLQICVDGLKDSFGKAVYKNVTIDMLIYKRLKLFLHAQSLDGSTKDDDARAFIRIGTDYTQNYYEYSLPLKITRNGATSEEEIWQTANMIDVAFQEFINAKARRNKEQPNIVLPFTVDLGEGRRITVVGNPDFSSVQGIMMGVLNPKSPDRSDKSFCVWADELRVADFDKKAGWAANARANLKLADLATVTATGSYTTAGFGALQEKIAQRARANTAQFDVNANITADKFLPEKLGIRIPVSMQYGSSVQEPRYDPLDPDTPLEQSLEKFGENQEARDKYRKEIVNKTTSKSINLLNVRKEKTNPEAKVRPYDIENLSLSYAYSELMHTDIFTDRDLTKTYTGGLAYTFNGTPKNYTPLSNIAALKSPYLKFLQEFNFTPLPSRIAFRADLDRRYNELFLQRRLTPTDLPVRVDDKYATFQKTFFFNRVYDVKWDLSKNLTFDYTATNRAVVDEPEGRITRELKDKNREIWSNLRSGGRTTNFDQLAAITYRLPLDKFPLTDWVSADTRYAAGYTWTSGSTVLLNDSLGLGNTIQNNSDASVTGKIDLMRLYNKVKILRAINEATPTAAAGARPAQPATGAPVAAQDTVAKGPELRVLKGVLKLLMSVQSVNFQYQLTRGNLVPGYLPRTKFLGFDDAFDAPGLPFILGKQYNLNDLYNRIDQNGWYTQNSHLLNTPFSGLRTENISARTNIVPLRNFNILVEARRERSDIEEAFYRLTVDEATGLPLNGVDSLQSPLHTGSYSISILSLGTMFEGSRSTSSQAFETFIANREKIAQKLAAANPNQDGTYNNNSQDVLIPAFLYAYRGKDVASFDPNKKANKSSNLFKGIPLPNWRVDYTGLSELPFMRQYFSSFTLAHAYSSVYNISNFSTSLQYQSEPASGFPSQVNAQNQFIPYYVVSQVTIMERMSPLIGINFKTLKNLIGRVEYRTERNLALNMTNAQITEMGTKDYVIGIGYATTNFRIPFKIKGERIVLKNELNARFDFTLRDNLTTQRSITNDTTSAIAVERSDNVPTNGTKQIQIKPTIDYTVNQKLNIQFYFTRVVSEPKISSSFKNTVSEGGIQLRYSLSQ